MKKKAHVTAVIVAAGSGKRTGLDIKKQFYPICGIPVIVHTLRAFDSCCAVCDTVLVTAGEDIPETARLIKEYEIKKVCEIVAGGASRSESVLNGLRHAKGEFAAIHDGARPCISSEDIENTIENALRCGASVLGKRAADTLKSADPDGIVTATVDRSTIWQAQTPQCFKTAEIINAYESIDQSAVTDDSSAAEAYGIKVIMTEAKKPNLKITSPDDIFTAEAILEKILN